ncbi:MAG TPA: hypothetical protein VIO94_03665, partial [Phenylobacterium sp.]
MRLRAASLLACIGLFTAAAGDVCAQSNPTEALATAPAAAPAADLENVAPFTEDDFLLLEVVAERLQLADGMTSYATPSGAFLPVGELARLLGLAITVDPARERAEGWVIEPERAFRIDLQAKTAQAGEKSLAINALTARMHAGELYVRADVLAELLPAVLKVDTRAALLTVLPTERLPFQERIEREARRKQLGEGRGRVLRPQLTVPNPYRAFTMPALALTVSGEWRGASSQVAEVRAAGDLAYTSYQFYAGRAGNNDTLRLTLEREDPDPETALIPGIRRFAIGDTTTPSLPVGPRNAFGRGIYFTTAPVDTASVFEATDIHGELPAGWEVELYLGEVLRASTTEAVDGKFEFNDLMLSYGLNTVRLVYYGPKGERREEVRRINVASGGLPKGQFTFSFGVVENRVPLFEMPGDLIHKPFEELEKGWRAVAEVAYGLPSGATVRGGISYAPDGLLVRTVGVVGLTTSILGYGTEFNLAGDDRGGSAATFGLVGDFPFGSAVLRHAEYAGGFIDEQYGGSTALNAERITSLGLDTQLSLLGRSLPLRVQGLRTEFGDGREQYSIDGRTSRPIGRLILSAGVNARANTGRGASRQSGSLAVGLSGPIGDNWRVRADGLIGSSSGLSASLDRRTDWGAFRVGYVQRFGDLPASELIVSSTLRMNTFDIGGYASYRSDGEARVGVTLSTGFAWDGYRKRYRRVGEAAVSGGAMTIHAFHDRNGDGRWQDGEPPVPNLPVIGGRGKTYTDDAGRALVAGLGVGPRAYVRVDTQAIEDPYVATPPESLVTAARPGRLVAAEYPIVQVGEIEVSAQLMGGGDDLKPLASVTFQLVDRRAAVLAEGRTGYDGIATLNGIPPGRYALQIAKEEADQFKMALAAPVIVDIPPTGGFVG